MNRTLGAALLGLALLPTAVFAQTGPAAGPGPDGPGPGRPQLTDTQRQQLRSTMEQSRQQMEQLHSQARAAMLGAISPVHRSALASIVGNLAIAPNPDYRGAAQQIDALLSPGERNGVIGAASSFRTQSKALREQQRQAFLAVLTPDQRAAMEARRAQFEQNAQNGRHRGAEGMRRTPDAGMLLLRSSVPHGMFGFGGPRGRGGPGPA